MAGANPNVAITGSLDPVSWRNLQRDLKRLEPEVRKELNASFRGLVGDIVSDAQSRASWSSRIPGAIGASVTTTRVGVKVNRRKAPHARSYEGRGRFGRPQGSFRHPVFGNRDVWVTETTRPFLAPAVKANQSQFYKSAEQAVTVAARKAGWK